MLTESAAFVSTNKCPPLHQQRLSFSGYPRPVSQKEFDISVVVSILERLSSYFTDLSHDYADFPFYLTN